MRTNSTRRLLGAVAMACVMALGATACGSSDPADGGGGPEDVKSALDKGGKVTVWAWEPTLKKVAADFEKKYPKVDIELVNAGTGDKQYTALQNAIAAGSGAPDVAQIEYYALGQFAIGKSVEDLAGYGATAYDKTFTSGPWNAVKYDKSIYALPMDSGPMALFYNKKVFDKHGAKVPTTWDEYVEAARTLHKADPKIFITNDTGDAGATTSLIWQAGGRPYKTDGTDVSIDFGDAGTKTYTNTWQKLLDEDLLAPVTSWSDEWYKGLADGSIATLSIGAWMPANFTSGVASASGDWRVAPSRSGPRATRPAPRTAAAPSPYRRPPRTRNWPTPSSSTRPQAPAPRPASLRARSPPPRRTWSRRRSWRPRSPTSAASRPTKSSRTRPTTSAPAGRTCRSRSTRTPSSTTPWARRTSPRLP